MFRVAINRNLLRLVKPSLINQVERNFSQLRVSSAFINSSDSFLKPTITNSVYRDFCTEQPKKKKQKKNPPAVEHIGRLDLRVGTIVEVTKAPDADTLYLTRVDIGGEYLSVVAGLAKLFSVDDLIGKNVVILCNLRPSKLRGHLSEGMIMCAKNGDAMEILEPPSNSQPGDLVYCENYDRTPADARDKKRLLESLSPDMLTNDELIACYKGSYLYVPEKGNIITKSLKNATIQ